MLQSVSMLCVPDALRRGTDGVEILFNALAELPYSKQYVFDMSDVTFILESLKSFIKGIGPLW